jgi:hypothetical protein
MIPACEKLLDEWSGQGRLKTGRTLLLVQVWCLRCLKTGLEIILKKGQIWSKFNGLVILLNPINLTFQVTILVHSLYIVIAFCIKIFNFIARLKKNA